VPVGDSDPGRHERVTHPAPDPETAQVDWIHLTDLLSLDVFRADPIVGNVTSGTCV